MIVGICGYAKSGKDTLANVIQYLTKTYPTPEHLDLEHALMWAGKMGSTWEIVKFADGVRDVARILAPGVSFDTQADKDLMMPQAWSIAGPMSRREFLQKLGTDAMRDNLHPDVWVNLLMNRYSTPGEKRWIVTDVRFPNEFYAIKTAGGIVVRVVRDGVGPTNAHRSETAIDSLRANFTVENNGSVKDLFVHAKKILQYVEERDRVHGVGA